MTTLAHPCSNFIDNGRRDGGGCKLKDTTQSNVYCMEVCPPDKYSGPLRTDAVKASLTIENRPRKTLKQVASFAKAATTGVYVLPQIKSEREAICVRCEHSRLDSGGVRWCSLCGCGVTDAEKQIRNLAAYVETKSHGCKHPQRALGKGWKR